MIFCYTLAFLRALILFGYPHSFCCSFYFFSLPPLVHALVLFRTARLKVVAIVRISLFFALPPYRPRAFFPEKGRSTREGKKICLSAGGGANASLAP